MRCEKHCTDLSSIDGVCASCLRQRLFTLIVAQEQAQAQSLGENNCNSDTNPAIPRSVSPYISRQKSDSSVAPIGAVHRPYSKPRLNHSLSDQRFYSSPQIVINTGGCIGGPSSLKKKQSLLRFSSISNLFRSNNRDGDADFANRVSVSSSRESYHGAGNPTSLTSSPAWFSNALPGGGGRHKKKPSYSDEPSSIAATGVVRKKRYVPNRGMSPAGSSDDDEFNDGSSEYESAESCKQTPMKTPSRNPIRQGHRSVSQLIYCLSPLVRASPNRLWSNKGKPPADAAADSTRPPAVPHLSYAKSFYANRSRKLADFGRSDPNR